MKFSDHTKRIYHIIFLILAITNTTEAQENKNINHKPLATTALTTDRGGENVYMVYKKSKRIDLISSTDGTVLHQWQFEDQPTGIALHGTKIYVTTSYSEGKIIVIDTDSHEITKTIRVGMGAISPIVNQKGTKLYVCNQFENSISEINLKKWKVTKTLKVVREPRSLAFDKNEKHLYVTNFLPDGRADIEIVAAKVSVIKIKSFRLIKNIALENGSNALRGICLSPEGKYIFVSHNLGRFQVPTSQLQQGWMNTSAVAVIDTDSKTLLGTILFDEPEHGASGIWGIQCNKRHLIVSHSGTHDITIVDYPRFKRRFSDTRDKKSLSFDLQFLNGIRNRKKIEGNGPRNILLRGNKLYVPTYFSDTLNIIDLAKNINKTIALNPNHIPSQKWLGERYFNDATFCFQEWQSCNGCHPGDARTDGLNWDLLNDGIGNPKNCKSLLYSHTSAPAMISGIRPNAETAVRAGFKHIQFTEVPETVTLAVDEYLKSLRPLPSPYLKDGKLTDNAIRGKMIYKRENCTYCHSGVLYSDFKMHKIGEIEFEKGWDTPILNEVWRTSPYLNNGSMSTLFDLFTIDKHGLKDKTLSASDIQDLIEYVNSL